MTAVCRAVHFDGSSYLRISAISCTDSPNGYVFFWYKEWANAGNNYCVPFVTDPDVLENNWCALVPSTGSFEGSLADVTGGEQLDWDATDAVAQGTSWHSFLCAWETNAAAGSKKIKIYVDDTDVTGGVNDFSPSFTVGINGLGVAIGDDGGGNTVTGDMAAFCLGVGTSLFTGSDIAVATRRLFVTAGNAPVDPAGFPGTKVILFDGGSSTFTTNQGSGGAFTLTGTLTDVEGPGGPCDDAGTDTDNATGRRGGPRPRWKTELSWPPKEFVPAPREKIPEPEPEPEPYQPPTPEELKAEAQDMTIDDYAALIRDESPVVDYIWPYFIAAKIGKMDLEDFAKLLAIDPERAGPFWPQVAGRYNLLGDANALN